MNIILIGMPGCGKTMVGTALAQQLQREFYDADIVLEEREGKTIPELFAISEEAFRQAETRTLRYLATKENAIIATGGGAVTRPINMTLLGVTGKSFYNVLNGTKIHRFAFQANDISFYIKLFHPHI